MVNKISKTGTKRLSKRERIANWRAKEAARAKARMNRLQSSNLVQSVRGRN